MTGTTLEILVSLIIAVICITLFFSMDLSNVVDAPEAYPIEAIDDTPLATGADILAAWHSGRYGRVDFVVHLYAPNDRGLMVLHPSVDGSVERGMTKFQADGTYIRKDGISHGSPDQSLIPPSMLFEIDVKPDGTVYCTEIR